MTALEINRLDKIARRSKRVGGAVADLWGGQYLCFGRELEKSRFRPRKVYPVETVQWSHNIYVSFPIDLKKTDSHKQHELM